MSIARKKFVDTMSTKVMVGRPITNEDIMMGIIMILQQDAEMEHVPSTAFNDSFDAKAVASAFYRSNKMSTDKEQQRATRELKKELSYIQYMEVVNEIANIKDNQYLQTSLIREMGRVVD